MSPFDDPALTLTAYLLSLGIKDPAAVVGLIGAIFTLAVGLLLTSEN
jgi:hypothetical protein